MTIVEDLDLSLNPGDRVALHGANGSGKTTILRCIAGTLLPTWGEVKVNGLVAGSKGARMVTGASLSQERSFYLRLTGWENLLFFARIRGSSKVQAVDEVKALEEELEIGHITARIVSQSSTGMVQQLGFARALLGSPKLLVLDEPTRSLDDKAVTRLWAAIDRRTHLSVVMATHRSQDLERCGEVIELPR